MLHSPKIIFEDDSILVLDKPSGMPSVSLKQGERGTLASWIVERYPAQERLRNGVLEAGLVHRLDNDTSGLVVAAKTEAALESLRRQFRDGGVVKEYLALVVGHTPANGTVETPIAHHPRKKSKMMACESDGKARANKAREARTEFELVEAAGNHSLLSVKIETGVRHQIRVHLASIGFPIAGDALYINPRMKSNDSTGLGRHFLHASRIEFSHPATGEPVSFESPLPVELNEALCRARRC